MELFGDEGEPVPGVRAVRAPGHNADMCVVVLDGGGDAKGVFWADLVPTTAHVPYPWIMSYDLYPMDTLTAKNAFVKEAIDRDMLVFFEHDPSIAAGRIREENGRRLVVPAVG